MTAKDVPVLVSSHARLRCEERWPGFKRARIVDEVREAIVAGRLSASKPAGINGNDHPNGLYAWPADEPDRVYGIVAEDERFVVKTVMRRGLDIRT